MARNAGNLKAYEQEFQAEGIEIYTKAVDAADDNAMSKALNEAVSEYGTPDVFAYNVGVTIPDSMQNKGISTSVLRDRYQVDVVGAYHCIHQIATEEFAKKNGSILATGGGLAMYPSADYLPLSMDKAALRAMVQALHPVLQKRGIFLGTLTVCNVIAEGSSCAPDILAEKYWQQYSERKDWEIVCQ